MKKGLPLLGMFVQFVAERYMVYVRKEIEHAPKPWTTDGILQDYRFCNVHRENDRVTIWIRENWRQPHNDAKDLWFAMVVARLVNWPDTLNRLTHTMFNDRLEVRWTPDNFVKIMHQLRAVGKAFGAAYIVSTNGNQMDKAEYLAQRVLTPLWEHRANIRPREGDTLEAFYDRLRAFDGMGSFMAAQVVADMKYEMPLLEAEDWMTFAASGPGSRRGLNRVVGKPVNAPWTERAWRAALSDLDYLVLTHPRWKNLVASQRLEPLHRQDLQNCLCEFDKYMRVKLGEGTPKCKYNGRS